MLSLTLIFHVASAIAFLFCIAWIIRSSQERRFWRQMWEASRANPQKKWILDWPHSFLRNFCHTIGSKFSGIGKKDRPCRIQLQPWIELDHLAQIREIGWESDNKLMILLDSDPSDEQRDLLIPQLESSLERQFTIELRGLRAARGADT